MSIKNAVLFGNLDAAAMFHMRISGISRSVPRQLLRKACGQDLAGITINAQAPTQNFI